MHIQKVFYSDGAVTNSNHIRFPEKLTFEGKYNYELVSFIEHFGSANFGHYICYRKFYDKWMLINDIAVRLIPKENALQVANPYMLFYRLNI